MNMEINRDSIMLLVLFENRESSYIHINERPRSTKVRKYVIVLRITIYLKLNPIFYHIISYG
jgi:hypothetical protein